MTAGILHSLMPDFRTGSGAIHFDRLPMPTRGRQRICPKWHCPTRTARASEIVVHN